MLAWSDVYEMQRDNRWQPLDTVPVGKPVDLYCHGYDRTRRNPADRDTARRFHSVTFNGADWVGVPPGWTPKLWADAMPLVRIRALSSIA